MNDFYKQPIVLVWTEAVLLMVIGFYPAFIIIEAGYSQPLFYLVFFIYLPFLQFAGTPLFRLTGIYKYYSPMLIGYMANNVQIDLHSGGSFDYLFVMRKFRIGSEIRRSILIYHLEGLLNIINLIESDKIPSTVNIVGTSYFFNERTANKFGFKLVNPSIFYRLNLMVNFIDLFWMYSVAKGRLSIPKIGSANKLEIIGSKLVDKKELIIELHKKLTSKLEDRPLEDKG